MVTNLNPPIGTKVLYLPYDHPFGLAQRSSIPTIGHIHTAHLNTTGQGVCQPI